MTNTGPLPGRGAMGQLAESKKGTDKNKTEGEQGSRKQEQGSMASRGSVNRQEEEKLLPGQVSLRDDKKEPN